MDIIEINLIFSISITDIKSLELIPRGMLHLEEFALNQQHGDRKIYSLTHIE